MSSLEIRLLGPMQVTRDNEPVRDFGADAARALLAYLALHTERPVPRDTIAGLLWPEWPNTDALRNLRTALYRLRDAIGDRDADPPYLDITRHTLQLSPDAGVQIDALAFSSTIAAVRAHSHASLTDCPACNERLTEAVRLYRGDFLDGFTLDSPSFEEWLVVQREALHQQALWALEQLADHYEAEDDHDQALRHARRQIALEPWRERAHRQAMRALAQTRHRSAALAQYEACRQSLSEELGIEPDPRTRDLYERIRAGSFPPPEKVAPEPAEAAPVAAPAPVSVPSAQAEPEAAPAPPTPTPPAAPTSGALPALEGERRRVTLILVDIPGSSDLLQNLGAEDWAEVIGPAMHLLAGEARQLGAEVQQTRPDALVATFGATVIHEDDAERAVMAALAMQQAFRAFADEMDTSLALRISVHTGEAIVSALDGSPTLLGAVRTGADAVHASLPHGALRVDDATYRAVAPIFAWRDAEDGAHAPLAHHPDADKGRGLPGLSSPLVGRDREAQGLQDALSRLSAGVGGIVTIVGEAGIGKSRLVAEARKGQRGTSNWAPGDWDSPPNPHSPINQSPPLWLEGRCLSYTSHVAYQMWDDVIRAIAEVPSDPAPEQVRDGLRRASRALCPDQFDDVYPLLVWMLGLPRDDVTETRIRGIDPEGLRVLAFRAVGTLLESAAARTPLVVALEDLHWADATSLALLEDLLPLSERAPVLFLCVMRPETKHACWHVREVAARDHYHRHTDLHLNPLTADESAALVGQLLSVEDLPSALHDRVLTRAEGNPFFLEEILRALIDDGAIALDATSGRWMATRPVDELPLPATLHGVISARIDRLPPSAKHVLQLAAVIGRIVPRPLLAAIASEDDLDVRLATLQRAQLLRERARLPEVELIFKHALTQEAAYGGLLRRKRRTLHRRVAEAIEARLADRIEEHLGLLAHHWEQAADIERAIAYLQRAGARAADQFANQDAVDYYTRALQLLPAEQADPRFELLLARESLLDVLGERSRQRGDLQELALLAERLGDAHRGTVAAIRQADLACRLSDFEAADSAAERATQLAHLSGEARDHMLALREHARALWHLRRRHEALDVAERALSMAEQLGPGLGLVKVLHTVGTIHYDLGDNGSAERVFRRELEVCREIGYRRGEGEALRDLGAVFLEYGDYEEAGNLHSRAQAVCRDTGDIRNEAWAMQFLGMDLAYDGTVAEALEYTGAALAMAAQFGETLLQWQCLHVVVWLANSVGQHVAARRHYHRAQVLAEVTIGRQPLWARFELELGRSYAALGEYPQARDHADKAQALLAVEPWPVGFGPAVIADMALYSYCTGDLGTAGDLADRLDSAQCVRKPMKVDPSAYAMNRELLRIGRLLLTLARSGDAYLIFTEAQTRLLPTQPDLAVQTAAGVAGALHAQGDHDAALCHVTEALALLQANAHLAATEELSWAYLICYRVLAAAGDRRANDLLTDAHRIVEARAAALGDPASRLRFLRNVPVNHEIIQLWERHHDTSSGDDS